MEGVITGIFSSILSPKQFRRGAFGVFESFWYRETLFIRWGITIFALSSVSQCRQILWKAPFGVCEYLLVLVINCTFML